MQTLPPLAATEVFFFFRDVMMRLLRPHIATIWENVRWPPMAMEKNKSMYAMHGLPSRRA